MKTIMAILLAAALVAVGGPPASAQSGNVTIQDAARVSPATHCKNAQGQIEFKRIGSGAGGVSTTGSAAGPSGSTGSRGTAASSAPGGSGSGISASSADLPPC